MRSKYLYRTFRVINSSKFSVKELEALGHGSIVVLLNKPGKSGSFVSKGYLNYWKAGKTLTRSDIRFGCRVATYKISDFSIEAYRALDRKVPVGLPGYKEEVFA